MILFLGLREMGKTTKVVFPFQDPPVTGQVLLGQISQNGAALTPCTNTPSEIGTSGFYALELTSSEMAVLGPLVLEISNGVTKTYYIFELRSFINETNERLKGTVFNPLSERMSSVEQTVADLKNTIRSRILLAVRR